MLLWATWNTHGKSRRFLKYSLLPSLFCLGRPLNSATSITPLHVNRCLCEGSPSSPCLILTTAHVARAKQMHGEENLPHQLCFPCPCQVSPTHNHPGGTGEQRQHTHTVLSSPPRGTVSLRYDCLKRHLISRELTEKQKNSQEKRSQNYHLP